MVMAAALLLVACGDNADKVLAGPHPMGDYVAEFAALQEEWEARCDVDIADDRGWAASFCRDRGYGVEWNLDCAAVVDIDIEPCAKAMDELGCVGPAAIPTACATLFVPGFGPAY